MMLTVGGDLSSGPGLLTEAICFGIAGRRFGRGSVYTSTGGRSTPIAGTILIGNLLESINKEILWHGSSYYLVFASVVATVRW